MEQSVLLESNCILQNLQISNLIDKITKMSKSPTIEADLSSILDDLLDKLKETDKYLDNGIFNLNFAEAALLLQSSADLYCKKVDILWDMIFDYQKKIVLSEKKNSDQEQELEKLEERKRKYKRKRKTKTDETQASELVGSFSFGGVDNYCDYLNQNYQQNDLLKQWQKFHTEGESREIQQITSKKFLFLPNNNIYNDDNEYIGRYNQFHSASLIPELFHLNQNQLLKDEHSCILRMQIDTHVINDFLFHKSIPSDRSIDIYSKELKEYINGFVTKQKDHPKDIVNLPNTIQTSSNSIRDKRSISEADSMFDGVEDDHFDSISNTCPSPVQEATELNNNNSTITTIEDDANTTTSNLNKSHERNKSCSQDSAFYELEDVDDIPGAEAPPPVVPQTCSSIIDNSLCLGSSIVIPQTKLINLKRILDKVREDNKEEAKPKLPKKRKVSEKLLAKLATGITSELKSFEVFFRNQYKPAEDEGEVPPLSSEFEDSESEDDNDDDHNDHYHETTAEENVTSNEEPVEETVQNATEENFTMDPSASTLCIENSLVFPSTSNSTHNDEEKSRKFVRDWRAFILPKLKNLGNKSDFDIHGYGSEIIEFSNIGETRPFKEIVTGKSSSEVARFFMATLQLANTRNVEISGVIPGKIANKTLEITILDKTRHHEMLEDYQAPSEESFRDRLEKVKALNPKIPLHSTPSAATPAKRLKVGNDKYVTVSNTSKRKLFK